MNQAPADDVFIKIEPGKNYTYTYMIDADQPPGLYWYHPHLHGSTHFQVYFCFSGICLLSFLFKTFFRSDFCYLGKHT